jgi:hypothetical protein
MSEEKKLTNEQVIVQDLVNQLQEKEAIIINLRVTITQLKVQIAEAQEKKSGDGIIPEKLTINTDLDKAEDKAEDKSN